MPAGGLERDPALDFVVKDLGPVSGLYTTGQHSLITPQFHRACGSNEACQVQCPPLGVPKPPLRRHLPGVIAQPCYKVWLETCGHYAKLIWAAGATPQGPHHMAIRDTPNPGYNYLINGATDRFSNPLVLNYPTDRPRLWLNVQPLNTYGDGTVFDNQQ